MERLPKGFRSQKILIQLMHLQLRNLAKRRIATILKKIDKKRPRFPFMVLTEATSDCTLNCIMCPRSQLEKSNGYMKFDLFKKVVNECSRHLSVGELLFSGIGEPFLHPQILEMGALAKAKGLPRIRITTNATLLTKQKTEKILNGAMFDEIGFSLDALTEETYKKIKRGANFQTVQGNIAYFLSRKGNYGRPFVSLHILKMRETVSEIDGFLKKWTPLLGKGDHILVKDIHNFAGQVEDRNPNDQAHDQKRLPCRQLWNFLYVTWDGDVIPCSMDPHRKLKIGNLNKSSLEELWNGPLIKEMRRIHIQEKYNEIPLCGDCKFWWY